MRWRCGTNREIFEGKDLRPTAVARPGLLVGWKRAGGLRRVLRLALGLALALGLGAIGPGVGSAVAASDDSRVDPPAKAVASPNLRVAVGYDFLHVDPTRTFASGGATSTLRVPSHEAHSGRAELVGTLPVYGPVGGRVIGRAGFGHTPQSLDGLSRGNNEVLLLGVGAELFLRDPELGSFAAGGGFDRLDASGSLEENAFSGTATASVFFPDLGSGPVDWAVRFEFTHREISGTSGSADFDADRYRVTGSAGWYLNDDFQLILGGEWLRSEEEFTSVDDRVGFLKARWRLPGPVPLELAFGGSVGVSEYKQSPFRGDQRLVYGASGGLVLRFGSGATLIDSIRRYD